MRDTFLSIANEVRDQTGYDIEACKIAVRDSMRDLAELNHWSWMYRRANLYLPAPYATGTCTLTQDDPTVPTVGATLTLGMVGRQFRTSTDDPYYTILDVDTAAGTITLDSPWADVSKAASAYSIFQAYITPPEDFFSWISVKDTARSRRLNLNVDQSMLDIYDPKRSSVGPPVLLSPLDYTRSFAGKVYAALQVIGAGARPVSGGTYSGGMDSIYTVQITASGAVDVATYKYKKNEGAFSGNIVCASGGTSLDSGVALSWPAGAYVNGDTFIIRTSTVSNPGLPRYEIYPYYSAGLLLPAYYVTRYPDISDAGVTVPRYIPGNALKESALGRIARMPNTDEKPNRYSQIARAENHEDRFSNFYIPLLMQQDSEVASRDVGVDLEYASLPWGFDMYNQQPLTYDPMWIYP